MDCYDWKGCPVNDGGCELCDLYIDGVSGWRFPLLKIRQFFIRLIRWDWSAGRVNLCPPTAAEMLRSTAKFCEFEAGRTRYNLAPTGSYWEGYDAAMKVVASRCREQAETLDPTPAVPAPSSAPSKEE